MASRSEHLVGEKSVTVATPSSSIYSALKAEGGSGEERDIGSHFRKRITIGLGRMVVDGRQTLPQIGREILVS